MNNKGFTISEVLVALVIFCTIAVPLSGTLYHLISDNGVKNKIVAIELAKNEMEQTLAFRKAINGDVTTDENGFKVVKHVEGQTLKTVRVTVFRNDKKLYELITRIYIHG
jgi:prepilin-type N-terminal cleavage/methylation domain-containing protein